MTEHKYAGTIDHVRFMEETKKAIRTTDYNRTLEGGANVANLEQISKTLGVKDSVKLVEDHLEINTKALLDKGVNVMINPIMNGKLIYNNEKLLVHKDTPIRALAAHGVEGKTTVLNIGAMESTKSDVKVQNMGDWNTKNSLEAPESVKLTHENFKKLLDKVKATAGEDFPLEHIERIEGTESLYMRDKQGNEKNILLEANKNLKISNKGDLSFEERVN